MLLVSRRGNDGKVGLDSLWLAAVDLWPLVKFTMHCSYVYDMCTMLLDLSKRSGKYQSHLPDRFDKSSCIATDVTAINQLMHRIYTTLMTRLLAVVHNFKNTIASVSISILFISAGYTDCCHWITTLAQIGERTERNDLGWRTTCTYLKKYNINQHHCSQKQEKPNESTITQQGYATRISQMYEKVSCREWISKTFHSFIRRLL
jgi:hypothetical protein